MPRVENGTREKTRTLSGAGLLPLCPELRGGWWGRVPADGSLICAPGRFSAGAASPVENWVGGGRQGLEQTGCAPAPTGKGDMRGASFWLLALGTFSQQRPWLPGDGHPEAPCPAFSRPLTLHTSFPAFLLHREAGHSRQGFCLLRSLPGSWAVLQAHAALPSERSDASPVRLGPDAGGGASPGLDQGQVPDRALHGRLRTPVAPPSTCTASHESKLWGAKGDS